MEKEDGQTFSVGELQHPGFSFVLFFCTLNKKRPRFTVMLLSVIILVIALCIYN